MRNIDTVLKGSSFSNIIKHFKRHHRSDGPFGYLVIGDGAVKIGRMNHVVNLTSKRIFGRFEQDHQALVVRIDLLVFIFEKSRIYQRKAKMPNFEYHFKKKQRN